MKYGARASKLRERIQQPAGGSKAAVYVENGIFISEL
jgi:hypothetical protein